MSADQKIPCSRISCLDRQRGSVAAGRSVGAMLLAARLLAAALLTLPAISLGADQAGAPAVLAAAEKLGGGSLSVWARQAQAAACKIYGAGGGGLDAYQSGFLVSPEGHVATAWSHVLDVDPVVVLDDGRRFPSTIVGFEPQLELAVLKIDADELPYFELAEQLPEVVEPVLAVSNLFGIASGGEPASVMLGSVAAISRLDAHRGTFKTPYRGPVLILDLIANNPGAAGGAVLTRDGRVVGMLGKELRDSASGVWLNYALPASTLREAIAAIVDGRSVVSASPDQPLLPLDQAHSPDSLGIVLLPEVLENTPAFIDDVRLDSPADAAGLLPDDLILLVGSTRIDSQRSLRDTLRRIDRRDPLQLTLQRGPQIVSVRLTP